MGLKSRLEGETRARSALSEWEKHQELKVFLPLPLSPSHPLKLWHTNIHCCPKLRLHPLIILNPCRNRFPNLAACYARANECF
jgi:hypothetical protein